MYSKCRPHIKKLKCTKLSYHTITNKSLLYWQIWWNRSLSFILFHSLSYPSLHLSLFLSLSYSLTPIGSSFHLFSLPQLLLSSSLPFLILFSTCDFSELIPLIYIFHTVSSLFFTSRAFKTSSKIIYRNNNIITGMSATTS